MNEKKGRRPRPWVPIQPEDFFKRDGIAWGVMTYLPGLEGDRYLLELVWILHERLMALEKPVAQLNLKRYCEVCEEETEWEFIGYQRDGLGFNLFALHNCVKCGASRNLEEK